MPCHVRRRSLIQSGLSSSSNADSRIGNRHVREGVLVLRLRRVEAVRGLVADDHHPRLAGVIALEPVERDVGDRGRVVTGPDLAPLAVEIELGAEILALALVRDEVVEAWPRLVVPLAHVILADVGGRVAGLLQHFGKAVHRGREFGEVVGHAVLVGVDAAQQRRPARRAQRRRAEGVRETHALVRDAIDLRRLDVGVPGVAERVRPEIVE